MDVSHAVWRVSIEEATAYFRRALDLAEAAHTLARILELNQNEDDRFPWIEYAQAMVPVAGRATLAMLARLDDRDVARLGLSLGPALTLLMRNSKLTADAAVALFGLAPPIEAWTWHISDFASEAVGRLPPEQREWLFKLLLVEIDRDDQLSPARKTIEGLHRLAEQNLSVTSPARMRIAGLLARRGPQSEQLPTITPASSEVVTAVFSVDLSDPEEIDRQILREEIDETGRRWPVRTLLDLAKRTSSPGDRLGFVRAVVEASAATLADKMRALDDYLEDWSRSSAAIRDALPGLGLRLATKHATELASSSTDAWGGWRGLERYFRANRVALVEHVVAGLRGSADTLGGNAWLALAARLAADASDSAIADGLERFLANSAEKLPAEVGDGPWDAWFAVPDDEATLVAGLLWARLGHPVAEMRWRAAHAVRRLSEVMKAFTLA